MQSKFFEHLIGSTSFREKPFLSTCFVQNRKYSSGDTRMSHFEGNDYMGKFITVSQRIYGGKISVCFGERVRYKRWAQ